MLVISTRSDFLHYTVSQYAVGKKKVASCWMELHGLKTGIHII